MSEELYPLEYDLQILSDDRICGNCRFWDSEEKTLAPVYNRNGIKLKEVVVSPCTCGAVEADAGVSVTLMAQNGRCDNHADAFEPCADYLDEIANPSCCKTFGVQPGLDFPASFGA